MPLDAVFLKGLTGELSQALTGARIDKVQQPARDLLLLSVHTARGNARLLISCAVGSARAHFTHERPENPESPPMFCMLLRKHLTGARIASVTQPEWERLLVFEIETRNELGYESRRSLIVELMGRSSNVILTDSDGVITDCMRRADFGETAYRRLLPGMIYRLPPPPEKPNFFSLDGERRRGILLSAPEQPELSGLLMGSFSGLCPLIARELAARAGERENLPLSCDALCESVEAGELYPTLLMENGKPKDFSFMDIHQYGPSVICERQESFSDLLDKFYAERDRQERSRRAAGETLKAVRTLRDRQARKLASQREELKKTADRAQKRERADLITANLYRLKRGDGVLVCENYFEDGCPTVEIALDTMKTPQQNAAALYKEYRKAAAAEEHLTELIESGERLLEYLDSTLDGLKRAESEQDAARIRSELVESGVLKAPRDAGKRKKLPPSRPLRYVSDEGTEILVGRSNSMNDELTFKIARRTDIWLHVQKLHGSHVIIRANGEAVGEETLRQAASLAVYHSEGRQSGRTPVDFTEARFVKKPPGSLPGKVIYTEYQTVAAMPDGELEKRLRA